MMLLITLTKWKENSMEEFKITNEENIEIITGQNGNGEED
jgi:hypothetical protein